MSTTEQFKKTIKEYLDNRAAGDELFAQSYAKENKNIDECINFILQQVQKSGCNGFTDEEVYGMAIHYYDEDSIKDVAKPSNCHVVVNHKVELTEEDKKRAYDEAFRQLQAEQVALLKKKPKHENKEMEMKQMSLF